jgi:Thermophilic glucose-6-phosphate isomerase and related metalloenzymes
MEKVTVEAVEPRAPPDENVPDGAMATSVGGARVLSEPLGTEGVAINQYELAPGESFAHSAHRHEEQEELFYVLSGTATFELFEPPPAPERTDAVTVDAGEVVRVPPGTFQFGVNRGDESVTALALGAPREYQGTNEYLVDCEDCGERTAQVFERRPAESVAVCRCTDCGGETHRLSP